MNRFNSSVQRYNSWPQLRSLLVVVLCGAVAACGSDLLLGLDAEQGVDGIALLGPLCPVISEADPCPDQPHQGWIRILDSGGDQVTRVQADEMGLFRAGLKPGQYRVVGESGDPFPSGGEEEVVVSAGIWTTVTVHFDTGIR
jgi:hypothetical protein